jgi:hypothetical protein
MDSVSPRPSTVIVYPPRNRLTSELRDIQGYWSAKAKEKDILTERDLARYLDG